MRSMKIQRHRLLVSLIALLITATMIPVVPASAATPEEVGVVPLGNGLWWDGEHVQNATMFWETCDQASTCWHYYLDVPEGGKRLRVGMDFQDRESHFAVRVRRADSGSLPMQWDPVSETDDLDHSAVYTGPTTLETFIEDPPAGRYLVTVVAIHVVDDTFRMRAVLDAPQVPDAKKDKDKGVPQPLLPNPVAVPPFNFTFDAPLDGGSQYEPPTYGTLDVQNSCTEDEKAISKAVTCLRFAAGGFNRGDGTLAITFDSSATEGPATQVVDFSDGSTRTSPAGTFDLHVEHRHFHYSEAIVYSLYEVSDLDKGRITPIGAGQKTSYCMVDYTMADWFSLNQDLRTAAGSNCGSPDNKVWEISEGADPTGPSEGRIGWSRGWGDMYPWWRQGQYVEFSGAARDGIYLVTSEFDPNGRILESNEDDNLAYSLIEISGFASSTVPLDALEQGVTIRVLERGRGEGPWDPHKVVVGEGYETWKF